jgi:transcriptional regulator with XRE-family HTH domain
MSQERLAADSGIDRAYVSEIETEKANASVDVLDRLAAVLDVTVACLLTAPSGDATTPASLKRGRKPRH